MSPGTRKRRSGTRAVLPQEGSGSARRGNPSRLAERQADADAPAGRLPAARRGRALANRLGGPEAGPLGVLAEPREAPSQGDRAPPGARPDRGGAAAGGRGRPRAKEGVRSDVLGTGSRLRERRGDDVLAKILIALVRAYQTCVSPFTVASCRYVPTCSEYARQALESHGAAKGAWLGVRRLARCHPWGGCGADPVPPPRRP